MKAVEDTALLSVVGLVGRVALDWWLDHKRDKALADDGRAELNADELVDLLGDLRWKGQFVESQVWAWARLTFSSKPTSSK